MVGLIQLLLLVSIVVLVAMPAVFVVRLVRSLADRRHARDLLIPSVFVLGAIATASLVWQMVPSDWPLSFLATLNAGVDSDTYGHQVEHAAEVIMTNVVLAGAVGGGVASGVATFLRQRRPNV